MTLKPITCPQCGKLLCRAKIGSEVELHCHVCKTVVQGTVDKDGGSFTHCASQLAEEVESLMQRKI